MTLQILCVEIQANFYVTLKCIETLKRRFLFFLSHNLHYYFTNGSNTIQNIYSMLFVDSQYNSEEVVILNYIVKSKIKAGFSVDTGAKLSQTCNRYLDDFVRLRQWDDAYLLWDEVQKLIYFDCNPRCIRFIFLFKANADVLMCHP